MRRLGVALATVGLAAGPAAAYEIARGASATVTVADDARACFDVYGRGSMYVVATASGTVTGAPLSDLPKVMTERGARPPSHPVTDVQPAMGDSAVRVCVAGAGTRAVSGRVLYTVTGHSTSGDVARVVECTFSAAAPPDCRG